MNQPAVYTPLESLFLLQSLRSLVVQDNGIDAGSFARISEQLRANEFIKSGDTYDAARLSPDGLQHLFLRLLHDEIKGEAGRLDGTEGASAAAGLGSVPGAPAGVAASPSARKKKQGSPPLPTLKDVYNHIGKIPALTDRLWIRYRDHIVAKIREDEERYESVEMHIKVLEKSESQRIARVASQNGAAQIAPRDPKLQQPIYNAPPSLQTLPTGPTTPGSRPPSSVTPVLPPKLPIAASSVPVPRGASPAHPAPGPAPIRPSPSPQPANAAPSGLQAPATIPPPILGPRPIQASPQVSKPAIAPSPDTTKANLQPVPSSAQSATPATGALKWEKQYKPIQAGQLQTARPSPPAMPPKQVLQQKPVQIQQGPPPPPPTAPFQAAPGVPLTPQSRPPSNPPLAASQSPAQQLGTPLQPGPPRPVTTPTLPIARPTSTTPINPPSRPVQPQQIQSQSPAAPTPRPIASAPPVSPAPGPSPALAPAATNVTPRRTQPPVLQPVAPQPPVPTALGGPPKDKPQPPSYANQPPRPSIPEHVIRHAATPNSAKRFGSVTIPHTPVPASPMSTTNGLGTKWATHSTPSTPGPSLFSTAHPESPAYEPVSPPQRNVPLPRETSQPFAKEKPVPKSVPKVEAPLPKPGRGRPPRSAQKNRAVSSTPSFDRRSQSVASQTDELSLDTPMVMTRIKDEEATPRPHEETGDTTADESVPSRSHMVTPNSVARVLKRKRQETPIDVPPPASHVMWTRGFTKVSASALEMISSHRDANMFATALRERDAPNYRQIVLQPQDITSIRSAIKQGNKAAVQASSLLPGGDPGTASVWLPASEDLVPPRGIINSAQLERELVHMFCNAIMYNPDPDRGPGPAFMKRSQDEEEEVVGYRLDENGVVKNTQGMFLEVEKLLGDLRSAEKERSAPPPSTTRPTSVATPAEDTQDDEDELAGEPDAVTGTVKRRRTTHRA